MVPLSMLVLVMPPMICSSVSQNRRRYCCPTLPTLTGTGTARSALVCAEKFDAMPPMSCGGMVQTQ